MALPHFWQPLGAPNRAAKTAKQVRIFNDDAATTRHHLVDEQFLDRGNGEYWRCGGSF